MERHPHSDPPHDDQRAVRCGVLTISDTRTSATDTSGQFLQQALAESRHQVLVYDILPDDPVQIDGYLRQLAVADKIEAVLCSGGTGIACRDVTYDVVSRLLEKELPGFGELFRMLSYQEIGSRAIASRATAGVYQNLLIFSLPGSTSAVKLAATRLILPELRHLTRLLSS
ncbi:Molybdenum cofactor biosynthesis protein B [Acaryochloris thomasi RCC1774]|uniref:Molybdenum cofactor biosynthesis protein B n=1 Tax=Acaryochloris thomasi RCC1774 TaxID=1764569 RepID=A0A2W1K1I1_9CYAN|nr:MogA/MoaB family molybdenum cofactor biosynthesis protein [Acaryochloris thomasi]PZD74351.1 Molybdenum cofactor biosynthesis protein B [Acaryochloris thomasi RCC1774]